MNIIIINFYYYHSLLLSLVFFFKHYYSIALLLIIKNAERTSTARARESQDFHVRGTDDVSINGVVEVSLLHV